VDRHARDRIRLGAVVAVAVAAAFVAWLALGDDEEPSEAAAATSHLAAEHELRDLARSLAVPLHWAGRRPGYRYEMTQTERGVFVRYLPRGVAAGDRRAAFLAAATGLPPAAQRTRSSPRGPGRQSVVGAIKRTRPLTRDTHAKTSP
jgi:hypothetical protein